MSLRGAALAIAGSLALAGLAAAQVPTTPQLNRKLMVAPKAEEPVPEFKFIKLPITLAPLALFKTMTPEQFEAAMKDWKPLTAGAIIGSPELYEEDGEVYLIATGANHAMHGGRIDMSTMSINPSSWTAFDVPHKSSGATSCGARFVVLGVKPYNTGCQTLTLEGASAKVFMHVSKGLVAGSAPKAVEGTLGKNPASPQLTYTVHSGYKEYQPLRFAEVVWDGSRLWSSQARYLEWGVIPMDSAASGLGCDHYCAYRRTDGSASYVALHLDITETTKVSEVADYWTAEWTSKLRPIGSPTPVLDGAAGQPDVVESRRMTRIFMPRKGGSLSYISGSTDRDSPGGIPKWGSWKTLGGAMAPDSTPSCAPFSQGAVCAIRALDGRVYARLVDISKGL